MSNELDPCAELREDLEATKYGLHRKMSDNIQLRASLAAANERAWSAECDFGSAMADLKEAVEALRECHRWMAVMSLPGNYHPVVGNRGEDYAALTRAQHNAAAIVARFDAVNNKAERAEKNDEI